MNWYSRSVWNNRSVFYKISLAEITFQFIENGKQSLSFYLN